MLVALQTATLWGQRWYGPYRDGVKAVEKGLEDNAPPADPIWQQAIEQLQRAIDADSRPDRRKLAEGTFREPYFPYLYLGIAHLRAGNLDEAERNFKESRDRGEAPKDERVAARQLALYEGELNDKLAQAAETDEKTGPSEAMKAFEAKVAEAQGHLGQDRWQQAIASFDEAERLNSGEFSSRSLSARRDLARQGWAAEKASSAQRLLNGGSLNQARSLFEEAAQIWPASQEAKQGLETIRGREQQYQRAKSQADQSFQTQDYSQAKQLYLQAQEAHPEMASADNLSAKLIDVDTRIAALSAASALNDCIQAFDKGNYQQAQTLCGQVSDPKAEIYRNRAQARLTFQQGRQAASQGDYSRAKRLFQQAISLDGDYAQAKVALQASQKYEQALADAEALFGRWGGNIEQLTPLNDAFDALTRAEGFDSSRFRSDPQAQSLRRNIDQALEQVSRDKPPSRVTQTVQRAALDLFEGRIREARQALESIQEPDADAHFFLGVAYATSALEGAPGPDFRELRSQALAQFQMALKIDSDYPPPRRLVSPLILGLFEEARQ